ncbi:MAG: hypothetical protein RR086_04705 [Clostridia bacterium]
MAKSSHGPYFGLSRLVCIILAIIPVTAAICGWIVCAQRKHWLMLIIRILFGWNIFWIVDLITVIFMNKIVLA